jgi:hypothetical protein
MDFGSSVLLSILMPILKLRYLLRALTKLFHWVDEATMEETLHFKNETCKKDSMQKMHHAYLVNIIASEDKTNHISYTNNLTSVILFWHVN